MEPPRPNGFISKKQAWSMGNSLEVRSIKKIVRHDNHKIWRDKSDLKLLK